MNPSPSRLVNWCRSKAVKAPGQTRAILLLMIRPLTIESQSSTKAVNPPALDRYQYTFGSTPTTDVPRTGSQAGITTRANAAPATTAIAAIRDQIGVSHSEEAPGACLVSIY